MLEKTDVYDVIDEKQLSSSSMVGRSCCRRLGRCLMISFQARADVTWNLPKGQGDWLTALNWNPNVLPTSNDTAYINDRNGGDHRVWTDLRIAFAG